jgi:hypothetical protein
LLPLTWTTGPNIGRQTDVLQNGLLMAALGNDQWAIGVLGPPDTLERLRPSFTANAQHVEIQPPTPILRSITDASLLLLIYDRNGLARAAKTVR